MWYVKKFAVWVCLEWSALLFHSQFCIFQQKSLPAGQVKVYDGLDAITIAIDAQHLSSPKTFVMYPDASLDGFTGSGLDIRRLPIL